VSLAHEVVEPFIEKHIAAPTSVEFETTCPAEPSEICVPVLSRITHCLGKATVQIGPDDHVWVGNALLSFEKEVGK